MSRTQIYAQSCGFKNCVFKIYILKSLFFKNSHLKQLTQMDSFNHYFFKTYIFYCLLTRSWSNLSGFSMHSLPLWVWKDVVTAIIGYMWRHVKHFHKSALHKVGLNIYLLLKYTNVASFNKFTVCVEKNWFCCCCCSMFKSWSDQ